MVNLPLTEEAVFKAACQIKSAPSRADYLRECCGDDPELHQRLISLLRIFDEDLSFLEPPLAADMTCDLPSVEPSGTMIGPYKLLEPIGEGGMGTVFMAQQNEPVRRQVAIKLIKAGMDTRQVIARFEAEEQTLAMMDHPNIAKVFDGGATESGRPYFVMELVRGIPIHKFCDERQLDTKQRLELFIQVCHGVQHAHQKGIIHRDLKPSNILVAMYDDQPVPKVIDFGVAKATGEQLTEKTMFTRYGQVIGTLEYMSPEQTQFNHLDVDVRSDIYSLGAILYELLTGSPPFDRERMKNQAFDETLRMIREEEPTKPSTKLSSTGQSAQIADNRQTPPHKLSALVHGELDWIVMKALEKDRSRRYETASGLALDIQRYLNNEPVSASSPSPAYKFRKFARRNRVALSAGLLVLVTLILGTAISIWQAVRATAAENQAQHARKVTAENFRLTLDSLKTAYSFADHLDEVPELEPWHREVLTDANETCQQMINRLQEQPGLATDLMELLVIASKLHYRMDRLQSAAESASRAVEIGESSKYDQNLSTQKFLASAYDQLAAVYRALGPSDGLAELRAANKLWSSEIDQPGDDSFAVIRTADNFQQMAYASRDNGDWESALSYMEQAVQILDEWHQFHDDRNVSEARVKALCSLATALKDSGERDRARELAQQAYDLASSFELQSDILAAAATTLAQLLCDSRATVELAETLFDQAREIRSQRAVDYPSNVPYLTAYVRSLNELAQLKVRLGKQEESSELLTSAIEIQVNLLDVQADNIGVLAQLAELYASRGQAAMSLEQWNKAIESFATELHWREKIQSQRDDVSARLGVATALLQMSECQWVQLRSLEDVKQVEALLDRAHELLSTLPATDISHRLLELRGRVAGNLSQYYFRQRRFADAEAAQQQSIEYNESVLQDNSQGLNRLGLAFSRLAFILGWQEKDPESVKQICLKAIDLQTRAIAMAVSDVEKDDYLRSLGNHYFILAEVARQLSQFGESVSAYERMVELRPDQRPERTAWVAEVYLNEFPEEFRHAEGAERMARLALKQNPDFINAKWWLAVALYRQGKFEQASQHFQKLLDRIPDDLDRQAFLGMTRYRLNDFEQANALLQKSYRHSTEASLYLVMTVARSKEELAGAEVTQKNVDEFFENLVHQSEQSADGQVAKEKLIEEARMVLRELRTSS